MLTWFTFTGDKAWAFSPRRLFVRNRFSGPNHRREHAMETADRIQLLVAPLIDEADVDLYDIEYGGGALRITVDRAGGVDMGVIGGLTRDISRLLDETDPIAGPFTLEVSSPGLERPLRTAEHFRRAVGETISVKTRPGLEGDRRFKATVVRTDSESVTLAPADAADGHTRMLMLADIERARTVFEWGPAPKPGGPKSGGPKSSPSDKQKKAAKS